MSKVERESVDVERKVEWDDRPQGERGRERGERTGRLQLKTEGDSGGEGGREADIGTGGCPRLKDRARLEGGGGSRRAGREVRR